LVDGLTRLKAAGATSVTIVVSDKTLNGYLFHHWRIRSLAMHASLVQLLETAAGLRVSFERQRERNHRAKKTQ
jgi:hypothetical protein